ncbi:MAG: MFS transporter [Pseudomonadota bacterium]
MIKKLLSIPTLYKKAPKEIYILALSRIINSSGNFVYPFLALFITQKLQLSAKTAGTAVLLVSIASILGTLVGGKLTDHSRLGRKKIMIIAQFFCAINLILCTQFAHSYIILFFIFISHFFHGIFSPANKAMAIDLTDKNNRYPSFSLIYLGHNIGCSIGPLLAGFLFKNYIMWLFIGDALTTLISALIIAIFLHETRPSNEKIESSYTKQSQERAEQGNVFVSLFKRPNLLFFVVLLIILQIVYSQRHFSLPLQLNLIYGNTEGPILFGTMMTINSLFVIAFTTIITSFTNKFNPLINESIASIFYALGFGMIIFTHSIPFFIISTSLWTIGEILYSTNSSVYIANHTPISHRGRFNAIIPLAMYVGYGLGPLLMGKVIELHNLQYVWISTFLLASFAAFALWTLHILEKTKLQTVFNNVSN